MDWMEGVHEGKKPGVIAKVWAQAARKMVILPTEMGKIARHRGNQELGFGQVEILIRYPSGNVKSAVEKNARILGETWARDRYLGTVIILMALESRRLAEAPGKGQVKKRRLSLGVPQHAQLQETRGTSREPNRLEDAKQEKVVSRSQEE